MAITVQYKEVNGTHYTEGTNEQLIRLIEAFRLNRKRIRLFYGDTETGRDWMEEYDTIGRIGRSMGSQPIPLLIKSERSHGGTAILTGSIVKITLDKQIVYQHPKYHQPELFILNNKDYFSTRNQEEKLTVQTSDDVLATFKTYEQARRWMAFIKGDRNSK